MHILTLLFLLSGIGAYAVPAQRGRVKLTQPDGTQISVLIIGDERAHYVTDLEGHLLQQDDQTGWWRIAPEEQLTEARRRVAASRENGAVARRRMPVSGQPRSLVVLVEYADVKFSIPSPLATFQRMLTEEGFRDYGLQGSAADYFRTASEGAFCPQFDVVGPVTLAHNMAYYGGTDQNGTNDARAYEMAIEACRLIDADVNLRTYDTDGDGDIDNVFVIYAGRGEASGGSASSVWPHSWDLSQATTGSNYVFDGVRLNHYACTNELIGTDIAGIGTFCHEFSHVLGLPDLYSTEYNSAFTPGLWSVLDQGSYLNQGKCPPTYSAYERYALGWLKPEALDAVANVALPSLLSSSEENQKGAKACIIPTTKPNEYYLIENRQQEGWDTYLPGHGMLVWHIDYNAAVWEQNIVNNTPTHQHVDLIEADCELTTTSYEGDPFPGARNVRSFTDTSTPSMRTWSGLSLSTPLTSITERDGVIYFKVKGGLPSIATPQALPAADVQSRSFTARWEAVDAPDVAYRLTVSQLTPDGTYAPHPRYNNLLVGNALSWPITHLSPDTHYAYSVMAFNDFDETPLSASMAVHTTPHTFAEKAPTGLSVNQAEANGCTASWEPMAEADHYAVEVSQRRLMEGEELVADFTGGLSAIPEAWTTDATAVYAITSYCGAETPALRLAAGRSITTPVADVPIRSISFWHRAVADGATLQVEGMDFDGQWQPIAALSATHDNGGQTILMTDADSLGSEIFAVRIMLAADADTSVAIDDIHVLRGGTYHREDLSPYSPLIIPAPADGSMPSLHIVGLQPATTYHVRVAGIHEGVQSAWTDDRSITTLTPEGLTPLTPFKGGVQNPVYDITGRPLAAPFEGNRGLYINNRRKAFIR